MLTDEQIRKELEMINARYQARLIRCRQMKHETSEAKAMKKGEDVIMDALCGLLCASIFVFVCWQLLISAVS